MPTAAEIIITIVTAMLGGGLFQFFSNVYRAKAQNRLDSSTAEKTLGEAWSNLYSNLERRVNHLENTIAERDDLIDDLTDWAKKLVEQLRGAKIEPHPFTRRKRRSSASVVK